MRKRGRTDRTQAAIVQALRRVGASVLVLSNVGDGCPDLLCGWQGHSLLLEVKDGLKRPSQRRLTTDQQAFVETWRGGPVRVVQSVDEAFAVLRECVR